MQKKIRKKKKTQEEINEEITVGISRETKRKASREIRQHERTMTNLTTSGGDGATAGAGSGSLAAGLNRSSCDKAELEYRENRTKRTACEIVPPSAAI